jgi:hypothetical protein
VRARSDRFLGVMDHRLEIVLGRLVGEGALAHDMGADGAMADIARVVDALGQRVEHVEELREGLPAPLDAGLHGGATDVLGAFEVAHHQVGFLGAARRQGETAIAHHHRRDALVAGAGAVRVPEDLRVHVGVAVDETGRHDMTLGVDRLFRAAAEPADLDDLAVLHTDIAAIARQPRTIDDHAVSHE